LAEDLRRIAELSENPVSANDDSLVYFMTAPLDDLIPIHGSKVNHA
jgi:hypothetical protein